MKNFLAWLGTRNAALFCIVFAILNKTTMIYHASTLPNRDEKIQMAMAVNLLRGHGLTQTKYFTYEIEKPYYDPIPRFPPGYSLTIAPLLFAFNNDEWAASVFLDILTGIIFIFLFRAICRRLEFSPAQVNLATVVAGCFQYIFFLCSYPTDAIALVFLLTGLLISVKILSAKKILSLLQVLFYSFIFFLPSFFRYQYIPVSIILPVIPFIFSFVINDKSLRRNSAFLVFGTLFFCAVMLFTLKSFSGQAAYIVETGRGFFPHQLLYWHPFVPGSFINREFFDTVASRITHSKYSYFDLFLQVINWVGAFSIFGYFIRALIKNKFSALSVQVRFFLTAGFFISCSIILLLAYLALTYKPQIFWNYNLDARYVSFVMIFIQLLFFTIYFKHLLKSRFFRIIAIILIFSLVVECAHGLYANTRTILTANRLPPPIFEDNILEHKKLVAYFKQLSGQYPKEDILVTSPDDYYLNSADILGYKPIWDTTNFNPGRIKVKRKTLLIVIVHDVNLAGMKEYIAEKRYQQYLYDSRTHFYIQSLAPGEKQVVDRGAFVLNQ